MILTPSSSSAEVITTSMLPFVDLGRICLPNSLLFDGTFIIKKSVNDLFRNTDKGL